MATHGVFGFPGTAPLSILCRLQVARSQALTDRTSWCLVGWNSTVVSAGDTASDFLARPHFGNGLVLPGPRTLGFSQSTPPTSAHNHHHHCCPVQCSLHSCSHRPSGSLKAHRTTPELPALSCKASLGEVAWGRCRMDPMGRRSPPGQQCYSFLRVKLAAHHSSGAQIGVHLPDSSRVSPSSSGTGRGEG